MNSQNRMNAGAEYVLCRIWATLQGRKGVHSESLITCLGALAGYACRVAYGEAAHVPLAGSPLSVWTLVRRAVQKLGKPAPDIDEIFRGELQVPDQHRPQRPAIVYVTQVWPQVLPLAQPFCHRPTQLPVLFGIALQRAIELTQEDLSPTLAAAIAMESAVAMSRVPAPEAPEISAPLGVMTAAAKAPPLEPGIRAVANRPEPASGRTQAASTGAGLGRAAVAAARGGPASLRAAADSLRAVAAAVRAEPARSRPAAQSRRMAGAAASARAGASGIADASASVRSFIGRFPPAMRMAAIASVAVISIAGAMSKGDRPASPDGEPQVKTLRVVEGPSFTAQDYPDEPSPAENTSQPASPSNASYASSSYVGSSGASLADDYPVASSGPEFSPSDNEIPRGEQPQFANSDGTAESTPPAELMSAAFPDS